MNGGEIGDCTLIKYFLVDGSQARSNLFDLLSTVQHCRLLLTAPYLAFLQPAELGDRQSLTEGRSLFRTAATKQVASFACHPSAGRTCQADQATAGPARGCGY